MKRLAAGIVLFLVSFSIPAPGSANLVFFTQDLGNSLNSIEKVRVNSDHLTPGLIPTTGEGAAARAGIHVAAQQFNGPARIDARFTDGSILPGFVFGTDANQPGSDRERSPTVPELAEWLLVLAGFALSGIAIRNRSNSRQDDRNPSFSRLPQDI